MEHISWGEIVIRGFAALVAMAVVLAFVALSRAALRATWRAILWWFRP